MLPSSRTPEGSPNRCPVCGNQVWIAPSDAGDAPCPCCGHLLWFEPARPSKGFRISKADYAALEAALKVEKQPVFDRSDSISWHVAGFVCATIVALFDWSLLSGLAWLAISVPFGRYVLPRLVRWSHRVYAVHPNFWLSLVFDWGMFPGPPVGPLFGALSPVIFDLPVSSLQGAILGLVVGPIVSAAEGFAVTSFFYIVKWLISGKRPDAG